jgi:hypothetical protein
MGQEPTLPLTDVVVIRWPRKREVWEYFFKASFRSEHVEEAFTMILPILLPRKALLSERVAGNANGWSKVSEL